jgi:hypothetical protein
MLTAADAFRRRSLELGVFYGIHWDRLVSVAGTHIVSIMNVSRH